MAELLPKYKNVPHTDRHTPTVIWDEKFRVATQIAILSHDHSYGAIKGTALRISPNTPKVERFHPLSAFTNRRLSERFLKP